MGGIVRIFMVLSILVLTGIYILTEDEKVLIIGALVVCGIVFSVLYLQDAQTVPGTAIKLTVEGGDKFFGSIVTSLIAGLILAVIGFVAKLIIR